MAESELERAEREFRAALLRRDAVATRALMQAYGSAWQRIRDRLNALTRQYYDALQAGEPIRESWLHESDRLVSLRRQVEAELAQLARFTETRIVADQQEAVEQAGRHAQQLAQMELRGAPAAIRTSFERLPKEALADLVGQLQNGAPLRSLLDRMGTEVSQGLQQALIQGVALGESPRSIAARARREFGVAMQRAVLISRTETLRSYRTATLRNYRANDHVLSGWYWLAAHSDRTCPVCLAMDGTFHPLEEEFASHPGCRCTPIPGGKSFAELGIEVVDEDWSPPETGEAWFARQDEATQRKILGDAAFAAYKAGAVRLSDFVGVKYNPVWGTTRYAKSLKEIVGVPEAQRWATHAVEMRAENERRAGLLTQIQALGREDVVVLGQLPREIVGLWTGNLEGNLDVVLTGRQRQHYLERHPDVVAWEGRLIETILAPDRVYRNVRDASMAIFYRQIDPEHFLRAAVLIQAAPSRFKHSILTLRLAGLKEVESAKAREVWRKP